MNCPADNEDCSHADKAADLAVKKVFAILGVDVEVPREVEKFREDLRFGASMRSTAEKGRMVVWGAVITTVIGLLLTGIWDTLTAHLKGH